MKRLFLALIFFPGLLAAAEALETDLLIVGGDESGCSAAVQAARLGVKKILLVNDIDWLGGQFCTQGIGPVDEWTLVNGKRTNFPRSGAFLEVIEKIQAHIRALQGHSSDAIFRHMDLHRFPGTQHLDLSAALFAVTCQPILKRVDWDGSGGIYNFAGWCIYTLPLRGLVPVKMDGLLGCSKNIGVTSMVQSSLRLHGQMMHVGTACGTLAALALRDGIQPDEIASSMKKIREVKVLLLRGASGPGTLLWPWHDVSPGDSHFEAANLLTIAGIWRADSDSLFFQADKRARSTASTIRLLNS